MNPEPYTLNPKPWGEQAWSKFKTGVPGSLYRGTSLIKNSVPLAPYSRNMPRTLWRP